MNKLYEGPCMDALYREIAGDLLFAPDFETESRGGAELGEIVNPTFILTDPSRCFITCRDMSMKYLKGELDFYMSGSPYLKDISKHSKFWNKVSDDGETITSNYGRLLLWDRNSMNLTQFEYAEERLRSNPDSKKAVMVIYSKDHAKKSKDNPCTMFLQFFLREGLLHLSVKMRSSDIWFGLPYDVPFFVLIQQKMATALGVSLGTYIHNAGSLHVYDRNRLALKKAIKEGPFALMSEDQERFSKYIISRIGERNEG